MLWILLQGSGASMRTDAMEGMSLQLVVGSIFIWWSGSRESVHEVSKFPVTLATPEA